jgi:CrcB protein
LAAVVERVSGALLVAVGGALGALARHGLVLLITRLGLTSFPYGTLCVNVLGSFAAGALVGWLAAREDAASLRLFCSVGLLGGFTTFSAFSTDALNLVREQRPGAALAYVAGSVAVALAVAALGFRWTR